jgi:hypothetical protein
MIVTMLCPLRHGPACPGHLFQHLAATGGPDKPGHDERGQPRGYRAVCYPSNAEKS